MNGHPASLVLCKTKRRAGRLRNFELVLIQTPTLAILLQRTLQHIAAFTEPHISQFENIPPCLEADTKKDIKFLRVCIALEFKLLRFLLLKK